jgi:hypothetical protein
VLNLWASSSYFDYTPLETAVAVNRKTQLALGQLTCVKIVVCLDAGNTDMRVYCNTLWEVLTTPDCL